MKGLTALERRLIVESPRTTNADVHPYWSDAECDTADSLVRRGLLSAHDDGVDTVWMATDAGIVLVALTSAVAP